MCSVLLKLFYEDHMCNYRAILFVALSQGWVKNQSLKVKHKLFLSSFMIIVDISKPTEKSKKYICNYSYYCRLDLGI